MGRRLIAWFCLLCLAACESASTPFADTAPQPQATLSPSPAAGLLRYGLDERLAGLVDITPLQALALVEILPAGADISPYDVVVALTEQTDWQLAPTALSLSLGLDADQAPLSEEAILSLVRRSYQGEAALSLRTDWAALGQPDGIRLHLAHPDHPLVRDWLSAPGLEVISRPSSDAMEARWAARQAHAYLFFWTQDAQRAQWAERLGDASILDLARWPISYRLRPGLVVENHSSDGLPLASATP